jgi:hypothetical protein
MDHYIDSAEFHVKVLPNIIRRFSSTKIGVVCGGHALGILKERVLKKTTSSKEHHLSTTLATTINNTKVLIKRIKRLIILAHNKSNLGLFTSRFTDHILDIIGHTSYARFRALVTIVKYSWGVNQVMYAFLIAHITRAVRKIIKKIFIQSHYGNLFEQIEKFVDPTFYLATVYRISSRYS